MGGQMTKIVLLKERCKGCGLCTTVCPQELLSLGNEMNKQGYRIVYQSEKEKCKGCKLCAEMCPDIAIEVWK